MRPVSIDGVFGWFSAGGNARGVVLCGTIGYEQHTAHRWWRDLGDAIALTGCSVLRFDYPGEGDSADGDLHLESALGTIRRAVRFLREEALAEEIVLIGLRLGGTFAALVASEGGIDGLVLVAPFTRGRAYLREMEMQARLIDVVPEGTPLPKRPGVLSVGGFSLCPDLRQDLAQVDLGRIGGPVAERVLVLGPGPTDLAAKLTRLVGRAETGDFPQLGSLLSRAEQCRMPEATRARIIDFVAGGAPSRMGRATPASLASAAVAGAGWHEAPVAFGDGLFGIRCHPQSPAAKTPAVLFVNMGADTHSGHGRQTTTLARTLAHSGVTSLRMDLRGVGDSADRTDGDLPLYRLDAVADIRLAIDALTQGSAQPVIVVGACNGAYLAFHAICQDPRVAAAVAINLYCFDWELTHGGEAYGSKPTRHVSAYAAMALKWATWQRILSGATPVRKIVYSLARRGLTKLLARIAQRSRPGQETRSIRARIAELRRRGAKLVMIYSTGDLGLVDLHTQLGSFDSAAAILGEPVRVIADADHAFSSEAAQTVLLCEINNLVAELAENFRESVKTDQLNKDSTSSMSLQPVSL